MELESEMPKIYPPSALESLRDLRGCRLLVKAVYSASRQDREHVPAHAETSVPVTGAKGLDWSVSQLHQFSSRSNKGAATAISIGCPPGLHPARD